MKIHARINLLVLLVVSLAGYALMIPPPAQAHMLLSSAGPIAVGRAYDDPYNDCVIGGLVLFAVTTENVVMYKRQDGCVAGGWSSWQLLGSPPFSAPVTDIDVAPNGEHVVIAGNDGSVAYAEQWSRGDWDGWFPLGVAGNLVEIVENSDGRLEIFAGGNGRGLSHSWQPDIDGYYGPWERLSDSTMPTIENLAAMRAPDGKIQVFVERPGSGVYTIRQASSGWGGWVNLGNPGSSLQYDTLTVGMNADGRLEVFGIVFVSDCGANCYTMHVMHKWLQSNGSRSGWASLGTGDFGGLSVGRTSPSKKLDVYACVWENAKNYVWHRAQSAPNSGYNGWQGFGHVGCGSGKVVVGYNPDGRLELFTLHDNRQVYHKWQTAPDGSWSSGWVGMF
ncbi:hypothetical protein Aple_001180 [Acrocarpospora pleiomorpha]|uniref:PLL-like beta propeller domain-containing protein n=1 Tax=Acrocarpospora pleiomorpha TaxID=90975 RepID=A0A5M3XE79_9ACTN|nr:hypothetical protein [Acrocarpospora pleiomorpha]GES17223.1 hypothetical protein Aple_001180 [Acrocarpospora pleiomorpha]